MTIDQFNILFDIRNDMAGLIASESERVLRAHQSDVQRENVAGMMLGSQIEDCPSSGPPRGSTGYCDKGGKNEPSK